MTHYDGLTTFPPPDADGLTRFAVPETDEEELIRLRAENARLFDLVVEERLGNYPMSGMMSDAEYEATREELRAALRAELADPE